MGVTLSTSARNVACDAIVQLIDAGGAAGQLDIYDSTGPTKLAELVFSDPAFTAAGDGGGPGIASAGDGSYTITGEISAITSGTADTFIIETSDEGAIVLSGTVSQTGGGGDIELNSVDVNQGDSLDITSLTVTVPATSAVFA